MPAGATTTFSLAVSNTGPSDADGVIVGDTLPAGLTLVSAAGDGWTCVVAGQVLSCSRPTLAAKTSAPLIALTVRVNSGYPPATITNTATVSSATKDVNPDNDSSSDKFQVTASADLILTKSHDKDASAVAGEEFTFDLVVRNAGPSDAQPPITVRDTLPAGLSYVSNGPDWTCTTSGTPAVDQVVECTLDGGEALIAGTAAPALTLTTLIAADTDPGELTNRRSGHLADTGPERGQQQGQGHDRRSQPCPTWSSPSRTPVRWPWAERSRSPLACPTPVRRRLAQ